MIVLRRMNTTTTMNETKNGTAMAELAMSGRTTSLQASRVIIWNKVNIAVCRLPKCSGSRLPNSFDATMAKIPSRSAKTPITVALSRSARMMPAKTCLKAGIALRSLSSRNARKADTFPRADTPSKGRVVRTTMERSNHRHPSAKNARRYTIMRRANSMMKNVMKIPSRVVKISPNWAITWG